MKKRIRIKKIKKLISNMNDEQINRLCFILVHKIQLNIAEREMSNKNEM